MTSPPSSRTTRSGSPCSRPATARKRSGPSGSKIAHSRDELDRYVGDDAVVPHKAGWITEARHDSGIVYAADGAFVVSVMTWTGGEAGDASDELAGRVAEVALERFRATQDESEPDAAA